MAFIPYSIDTIKTNIFTQGFPQELERDFFADYYEKSVSHVRMVLIMAIFFYGFFGILDAWLVPEAKVYFWAIRYGIFTPLAFVVFLFSFSKHFRRYMQLCVSMVVLVAGLGIIAMIMMFPQKANDTYYAGLILVFMFGYTFFKLRFIWATIIGWIIVITYEFAAISYSHTPMAVLINNNFFFIAGNIIGMFACYSIEFNSRKEFIQTRLLETEKKKVNAINRELEKRVEERTKQLLFTNNELKQEVGERKRAEQEIRRYSEKLEEMVEERTEDLRKSEEKYRTILENITDGYYEVDLSGKLTFFNDSLCKLAGYEKDELMNMSNRDYTDDDNARKLYQKYNEVFRTGEPEKRVDWELKGKEGTISYVESSVSLIVDAEGNPTGFRGIVRDVTERRLLYNELKEKRRIAEDASRAKSEFLANMSHEIRTPLNGIIGMTELAMDSALDDNQKNIFHAINTEANTLFGLINDILDFSKIEAGKIELEEIPFDLRSIIEDVSGSIAFRAEQKGLELIVFLAPDIPHTLMGDPGRLRQILNNLAGNALKFTEHGEIYIKAEIEEDLGDAYKIKFLVRDTGIGIPADKQEKIFECFTQSDGSTTRKYGGTGLGTTISKQLVELMNGEIWVASEIGKGSDFWFTSVLKKAAEKTEDRDEVDLNGLRVLVVDDNQTNRFIQKEYLRAWGCLPSEATGGAEALDVLRNSSLSNGGFDLILTDAQMPELSGFDLALEIKKIEEFRKTPIIILTSSSMEGDRNRCKEIGIAGYLTKPIRREEMRRAITSVLGLSTKKETEPNHELVTEKTITPQGRDLKRILLAEDYPTNQQVAMRHLTDAGYRVDLAENGLRAVEAFEREQYDLVLMDIQMPVMEGYEATRTIREIEVGRAAQKNDGLPRTPIIALTAHALKGDREKCFAAGMDDYLTKPLRRSELLRMVDKWLLPGSDLGEAVAQETVKAQSPDTEAPMNFGRAIAEFEGDKEFLLEVLDGFLDKVQSQITIITQALNERNNEVVWKEAHAIKGGAANLTAQSLSNIAHELEKTGKSDTLDGALDILEKLRTETKRLEAYAQEHGTL